MNVRYKNGNNLHNVSWLNGDGIAHGIINISSVNYVPYRQISTQGYEADISEVLQPHSNIAFLAGLILIARYYKDKGIPGNYEIVSSSSVVMYKKVSLASLILGGKLIWVGNNHNHGWPIYFTAISIDQVLKHHPFTSESLKELYKPYRQDGGVGRVQAYNIARGWVDKFGTDEVKASNTIRRYLSKYQPKIESKRLNDLMVELGA